MKEALAAGRVRFPPNGWCDDCVFYIRNNHVRALLAVVGRCTKDDPLLTRMHRFSSPFSSCIPSTRSTSHAGNHTHARHLATRQCKRTLTSILKLHRNSAAAVATATS